MLRRALLPRLLACLLVLPAGCSSAGDDAGVAAWADGMPDHTLRPEGAVERGLLIVVHGRRG
ncbi:hypothetical protein ACIF9R_01765 [Streptomyces sp. NPDC086080]|uniref:hypothetical protein n=1 Tax=Streptomyces sp. NPDC086080 TaxID=3365748 RepID=UPI0037D21A25